MGVPGAVPLFRNAHMFWVSPIAFHPTNGGAEPSVFRMVCVQGEGTKRPPAIWIQGVVYKKPVGVSKKPQLLYLVPCRTGTAEHSTVL